MKFSHRCKRFFAHLILEEGLDEFLQHPDEWELWARYYHVPTEEDEIRDIITKLIPPELLQFNTFGVVIKPGKEKAVRRLMKKAGITRDTIQELRKTSMNQNYIMRHTIIDRNEKLDRREKRYLNFMREKLIKP